MPIAAAYFLFLAAPVALLALGSFGASWSNTLLPSGVTDRWYLQLASDPSFRRAFATSLEVVAITGLFNIVIGLPLAYVIKAGAGGGASRLAARLLTLLPVAVPELVLAFGFILVFSSDALPWLGSFWLLAAGSACPSTGPWAPDPMTHRMKGVQRPPALCWVSGPSPEGWWLSGQSPEG